MGSAGMASGSAARDLQEKIEKLMPRLRIGVVFGGNKSNPDSVLYRAANTRSWKSYEAVANDIADSLRRSGFRHVYVIPEDMNLPHRLRQANIHLAWLNTGGVQGYNPASHASALLEMAGVPYVGHDPLTATTLDNKHAFKREAAGAGIRTAEFSTWNMTRGPFRPDLNSCFQSAFANYDGPFIVKPVCGRASLHVHVVQNRQELPDVIAEVYRETENTVLIERYLGGREFAIAVAGPTISRGRRLERGQGPFTFAALERTFDPGEQIFTSMDVRPITADRFKTVDPDADRDILGKMRRMASELYLEFNLASLVRLDLRADAAGQLYVLEANPKPDLKRPFQGVTSLICGGLADTGMDYDDLIFSLLADRIDFLLAHRRGSVGHITELLESSPAHGQRAALAKLNDALAGLGVPGLNAMLAGDERHNSEDESTTGTARANRVSRRIA
jgi:D-alanine-D-alanine ligase